MNNTAEQWFDYEKVLTETDILEIAKKIGETRKKIDEIEEARKTLKNLQHEKLTLERQLEQGKATGHFNGIHSYHDPEEGLVTISPNPKIDWRPNSFTPFTREMTQYEKEKYCQHTIDFKEPEQEEDINLGIQITKENEELLEQEEESDQGDEDSFTDRPGFEEHHTKGDYFIKAPDSFNDAMMWTVLKHCGHGVAPDLIGFFYRESDAIKKVRELRKEANAFQEQITADQIPVYKSLRDGTYFLLDNEGKRLPLTVLIEADLTITFIDPFDNDQFLVKRPEDIRLRDEEPQPLSALHVYKSPTNQYYILDEQLNPIQLKVLNSLENVVFLEQEGVEGVILKRHSEVTPGGELE
jgi:hypothetical protein